ncbi:eukaryotic translation initiation factor 3 subunit J-like protein [Leptotrombidium deliense]|uniref:Eukaryotic translation initiation factor 3 subunit J n=1 Tax=Leptotrombidium deliense TaxID=299467 RepID=A0A443S4W0_9ACAR|nr:eukaryotic translation initiation factor 3 subunit J-like protein [Leptotrombidium deliense]
MSDADWDKEGFKTPIISTVRRDDRWEGEDEEEDIKDNWDDDDEEEVKSEEAEQKQPVEKKKKKNLAVIIAEKEEKRRKELEEKKRLLEEQAKASAPKTQEEILAERLQQQRLQEESDLMLAKEAFGVSDAKAEACGLDVVLSSKEDFDNFKKNIVTKLQAVQKSPHYLTFLETAFREICVTLETDDIKRISNNLNALYNEKLKAQKQSTKNKKKPKSTIKIERSDMDAFAGDDYGNEFDEFI